MRFVGDQLRQLDGTPDVVVLSIGGNDAFEQVRFLERPVAPADELLNNLLAFADRFADKYEEVARPWRNAQSALCSARSMKCRWSRLDSNGSPARQKAC